MRKVKIKMIETLKYDREVVVLMPNHVWAPETLVIRVAAENTVCLEGFASYLTAMGCEVSETANSGFGHPVVRDLAIVEHEIPTES